jgi:hypothetical protein
MYSWRTYPKRGPESLAAFDHRSMYMSFRGIWQESKLTRSFRISEWSHLAASTKSSGRTCLLTLRWASSTSKEVTFKLPCSIASPILIFNIDFTSVRAAVGQAGSRCPSRNSRGANTVLTQKSPFENALNRDFQKRVLQPTLFKRPQLNA